MVAVGDQELAVGEELAHGTGVVEPPHPGAGDVEVRRSLRRCERRRSVVEEEDRLQLHAGRAQEAKPSFLRPGVGALVGEDDAALVRLDAKRRE